MEEHCYIIIFDICDANQNSDALIKAIKQYSRWGKISNSAWAVVSAKSCIQIRDNLKQYIEKNDTLMVIQSGKSAAWTMASASDLWLRENLIK